MGSIIPNALMKWNSAFATLIIIGTFRSLRFTVGTPLKSCTHTGIFPSVSGHPTVKRRLRKVPKNIQWWCMIIIIQW